MSCLRFDSIDDYYKIVDRYNEQFHNDGELTSLITECKKNYQLAEKIRFMYNAARSKIFLYFMYVLDNDYFDQPKELDLKKIKQAIYDCISICNTYLDLSLAFVGYENETKERFSYKNIYERVKLFARRCFRYHLVLQDLCIYSKNYAVYLLKKLFNESANTFNANRICIFDEELDFDIDKNIQDFEKQKSLDSIEDNKKLIEQVINEFNFDLYSCDDYFSIYFENNLQERD